MESPNPYDAMHKRASLSLSYINAPGGPSSPQSNLANSEYARRSSVGNNGWVQAPLSSSPPPFLPTADRRGSWNAGHVPQLVHAIPVQQQVGGWVAVQPAPQPVPIQVVHVPVQSPVSLTRCRLYLAVRFLPSVFSLATGSRNVVVGARALVFSKASILLLQISLHRA